MKEVLEYINSVQKLAINSAEAVVDHQVTLKYINRVFKYQTECWKNLQRELTIIWILLVMSLSLNAWFIFG